MKILVAVDGSKPALEAVDWLIKHTDVLKGPLEAELVTVHHHVPEIARVGLRISKGELSRWNREQGEANLAPAKKKLERAGIAYKAHILVGPAAEKIVSHAQRTGCDLILLGTSGMGRAGNLFGASVATKVLHITKKPVLLAR